MALYSNTFVKANGQLLMEHVTLETELTTDAQDVLTMAKNWAGITPSPQWRTATIVNALPLPGVEFDFEAKMLAHEEIELQFLEAGSGKTCTTKGYITNVARSSGVGQNSTVTVQLKLQPSAFL